MIEKLSPEQEARLITFREEWREIGLCTKPAERKRAEDAILAMRREIKVEHRPIFFWGRSPVECLAILWVIKQPAWSKAIKAIGRPLLDQLGDQLGDQLRGQLRDQLWGQLRGQLRDQLRGQLKEELGHEWWGQHEAYWISFYKFCEDVLTCKFQPQQSHRLNLWAELARSCSWWWCYKNYVVCCERPSKVSFNAERRLHATSGGAVEFKDGWKLYALNGVRVEPWIVETPTEKLDPARFATIENAEIRREFVRKVGIERIAQKLGAKTLDTMGDYELLLIDLKGTTGEHPYLKMKNPSIGVWHLEAVAKECKTVKQALAWRNGLEEYIEPEILT